MKVSVANSKLECLREHLARLVTEKESLIDPHVVALSQEMDDLIMLIQNHVYEGRRQINGIH